MKFQKSAISLMVAGSVFAGDAALSQESKTGFVLEEVVVTARKREENLQNTPLSISAFTANELQQRQIRSTDQLADVTPNLTFDALRPPRARMHRRRSISGASASPTLRR